MDDHFKNVPFSMFSLSTKYTYKLSGNVGWFLSFRVNENCFECRGLVVGNNHRLCLVTQI